MTPRSDLIVVTEEAVLSVRPESLSDPRWVTPVAPYARVMISGDVVFIGDTPHRRSDGTALEWQADVEPGYSGGLRQFAGRLYDTGDGSTLTPVDPMSGEPCGETIAVRSVTEGPNGLFVIDDAGTIAEYDRSATRVRTLGTATGEAYGVLGGRFTEALDDGDLLVHGENGTVEISGSIVGHSDRHVVTQPAEGGPLTLVDLDTGATVWTSDPRPSVEIWAGYVQTVTDDILLKKVEFLRGAP